MCRQCCEKYLLDLNDDPKCMYCKKPWEREVLTKLFTKVFLNTTYKSHRENLLMDREKSLLVECQNEASRILRQRNGTDELTNLMKEYYNTRQYEKKLKYDLQLLRQRKSQVLNLIRKDKKNQDAKTELTTLRTKEKELKEEKEKLRQNLLDRWDAISVLRHQQNGEEPEEKRKFIKACPATDCRGMLSTQWKCGICNIWVCPECHEIKGTERDVAHTCNSEILASVKLLKDDSKPCPKCSAMIFRQSGCSHMFCCECKTAFDYITGKIHPNGNSNPLYHQWRQQRGMSVEGFVCNDEWVMEWNFPQFEGDILNYLQVVARELIHIRGYVLRNKFPARNNVNDNRDLRIQYILKVIEENEWKRQLVIREKDKDKKQDVHNLLDLGVRACNDILRKIIENPEHLKAYLAEMEELRTFVNEEFIIISKRFNCKVWNLCEVWALE